MLHTNDFKTRSDEAFLDQRSTHCNNAKRRSFLTMLSSGLGGMAIGALPGCGSGRSSVESAAIYGELKSDAQFFQEAQKNFSTSSELVSMNVDVGAVVSSASVIAQQERSRPKTSAIESKDASEKILEQQRLEMAQLFAVPSDQMALTRGASIGICQALSGVQWLKNDAVVTTDQEYPTTRLFLSSIQEILGVKISVVSVPKNARASSTNILTEFEERCESIRRDGMRVRALVWSSPTYQTGTLLPIVELANLAKKYGAVSICDGAHLLGMMDVDFASLGIDILIMSGHKWQAAPKATGLSLFSSNLKDSEFLFPVTQKNLPLLSGKRERGAYLTQDASPIEARISGLIASCKVWQGLGRSKGEAYALTLSRYLKNLIAERWGDEALLSPKDDLKLHSGIVAFNPFSVNLEKVSREKSDLFVSRMKTEHKFILRNVAISESISGETWPIRITTPIWVNGDDVERLVDAMWAVSRSMS